jgi:hypothetical protein
MHIFFQIEIQNYLPAKYFYILLDYEKGTVYTITGICIYNVLFQLQYSYFSIFTIFDIIAFSNLSRYECYI